ncbi:MAG: HD domain-containing protein [Dysgonamonadaceae bacterium]|jgi:HD superfamily phosphohydrolase|nr:HD domain-containing protein [Dysgonamonadaceae bacterium]
MTLKRKIINDPVFGFINIPDELIFRLINHPYIQRLNRIKQLGLAFYVYPGAVHSRFHHSIGAMHLMAEAIAQLRSKGHSISDKEEQSALACILMHDIGHGPFSHVLEHTLVNGISHEDISLILMNHINRDMDGALDTAIEIFRDTYPKRFLHQLVSGQLDMDRLDYLRRDSFFTGVTEGNIGSARIIKMLNLKDDKLVVEAKGIYSIENFLMARRLMYWQVYLHKTAVAAEKMLINTLKRAKHLAKEGIELEATPSLHYFLYNRTGKSHFENGDEAIGYFTDLDDNDIWCAMKAWTKSADKVLALLSDGLVNRNLFKIEYFSQPVSRTLIADKIARLVSVFDISEDAAESLVVTDEISTNMYSEADDSIDILYKDGSVKDIAIASDMLNIHVLSKKIGKYYLCFLRTDVCGFGNS